MGIYLFKRKVLEDLLQDQNPSGTGRQDEHFGYDVIPHALRSGAKVSRTALGSAFGALACKLTTPDSNWCTSGGQS